MRRWSVAFSPLNLSEPLPVDAAEGKIAALSPEIVASIRRIYRSTHILATLKRDELPSRRARRRDGENDPGSTGIAGLAPQTGVRMKAIGSGKGSRPFPYASLLGNGRKRENTKLRQSEPRKTAFTSTWWSSLSEKRPMTSRHKDNQSPDPCVQLRSFLLGAEPAYLERLAQSALSNLLDVPFRSARAGDQRGGDGGASGTRDLVFEARRYEPTTSFDERGIRGQILQAIERKPDLEAWILVSTREVPEQVQDTIDTTALGQGIAAFSIDWLRQPLPRLAVLSASNPHRFRCGVRPTT